MKNKLTKIIGARYIKNTKNSKLAGTGKNILPIDATYISIKSSCPKSCPMLIENSCYAEAGYVGIVSGRLDKEAFKLSSKQIAIQEAKCIDNAYKGKPVPQMRNLRLHVSGDSRTIIGTGILAKAIENWQKKGGGKAFTFTHAWKKVPRKIWGPISVLASIDTIKEVELAREQGYAPAMIVSEFKSDKAYKIENCDITWIPCPAITQINSKGNENSCQSCKLCINSDRLFESKQGILFTPHGRSKNIIKKRLNVIQ